MLMALMASGCTAVWVPDSEIPDRRLQWLDASGRPLLGHIETLKGFHETGSSPGSIARSIIFGRSPDATFVRPVAVAVGADGRIAVVDAGCACVHFYSPDEKRYRRILGMPGERLNSPVSAIFDGDLRLYVADSAGSSVFVFNALGEGERVLRGAGGTPFRRPTGLAFAKEAKTLYVTDTAVHSVYALRDDDLLFRIGGRGIEQGSFNFPTHLIALDDGTLYVTDAMNFRIQSFDGAGRFISSFGRHGDGSGDMAMPKGVAADREGVVYVVDGLFDNVQLFSRKGDFLLTVGSRGRNAGEFWLPSGMFLDENDKLYVCDTYNQRVQIFQIMHRGNE